MSSMKRWNGTAWEYITVPIAQNVALQETAMPAVPPSGYTLPYAHLVTGRLTARDDKGGSAMIDYRRDWGNELRMHNFALGARLDKPWNGVFMGDSFGEGAGATTFDRMWLQIIRDGLQKQYKQGGVGFIPAVSSVGSGFFSSVPTPVTYGGSPDVQDYGVGLSRHGVFLNGSTQSVTWNLGTINAYCDQFYIMYTALSTSGSFTVTLDGVAIGTVNTVTGIGKSGAVWDSGVIPRGYHTITLTPVTTSALFIEGIVVFDTDATTGVHVWNGGHGGFMAANYNGQINPGTGGVTAETMSAAGSQAAMRREWAQTMWQPHTLVDSGAVNVTSGGQPNSVLTWAGTSPAFTNDDIGEVVFGDIADVNLPGGLRIQSVTSATVCAVNKRIPAGTYRLAFTRSRLTGATVTSGSLDVVVPGANLTKWDEGKTIAVTNMGAAVIDSVQDATHFKSSYPATATATGTATVQIKNRQKYSFRPHLFGLQFGGNEQFNYLRPKAEYKTNMYAVYQTMLDYANIDIPTMAGINNDERPSVLVTSGWATGGISSPTFNVSTQSGSNIISKPTTGDAYEPRFHPADIGLVISSPSNTPIPAGSTITGMSGAADPNGYYYAVTINNNAAATTTAGSCTIINRNWQEEQWRDFRQACTELCDANLWAHFDLFNFMGWVGLYDIYNGICQDGIHPNDYGQQQVADLMAKSGLGGQVRQANIPERIFNNAGEIIVAEAADRAKVSPGIKIKTSADVAANINIGTYTDLTELAFQIGPNQTLSFQFYIIYTSPLATSGITFRLGGSASMSTPADFVMTAVAPGTGSTFTYVGTTTASAWPNGTITATGSNATTTPVVLQVYGAITAGAYGGTVTPQFTTEVASSVPTVQRGSFAVIL